MQCRICGSDLDPKGAVSCARCRAAFHRDCWLFNGMCGIYGCGGRAYVGFDPTQARGDLVEIDERTRAPISLEPYKEGAIRALRRWGKIMVPASASAGLGSFFLFLVYLGATGISFDPRFLLVFLGCGIGNALLAVPLGGTIRRHPAAVAKVTGILAAITYGASRVLHGVGAQDGRVFAVGASIVLGMLFGNALAERVTAPWRFSTGRASWLSGAMRPILTGGFLFVLLTLFTLFMGPHPLSEFITEIAIVSVLGLFVAAPPLELSKSAALRRKLEGDDY